MSEQTSIGTPAVPSKWKLPVPTMWGGGENDIKQFT